MMKHTFQLAFSYLNLRFLSFVLPILFILCLSSVLVVSFSPPIKTISHLSSRYSSDHSEESHVARQGCTDFHRTTKIDTYFRLQTSKEKSIVTSANTPIEEPSKQSLSNISSFLTNDLPLS